MKHFMTATISAASKSQPPRKKVLAERNEYLETTPVQMTPTDLDSRTTPSIEELCGGDNVENALLDDLSSRPYDPITNYLSPRPRFLRFKPSRRGARFLEREGLADEEGKDGLSSKSFGFFDSMNVDPEADLNSLASDASKEDDLKQECKEQVVDDESEAEEEEEEAEEGRNWGLRGLLKFLFVLVMVALSAAYISNMNNSPAPIEKVVAVLKHKDGYQIVQDQVYGLIKNLGKKQNYFFSEIQEEVYGLVKNLGKKQNYFSSEIKEEVVVDDVMTNDEFGVESEAMEVPEYERHSNSDVVGDWNVESDLTGVNEPVSVAQTGGETEASEVIEDEESGEVGEDFGEEIETLKLSDPEHHSDPVVIDSIDDEVKEFASSEAECFEEESEFVSESYETGNERHIRTTDSKSNWKPLLCIFMSFLTTTGASIFYCKRSRRKNHNVPPVTESSAIVEPTRAIKRCTSLEVEEKEKELSDSLPISTTNADGEDAEKDEDSTVVAEHETGTPSIMLLSEFDVGEMSTSTIRSGIKSSRVLIDSEVSSHSVSLEHSVPLMSPSSYGRFTDEKKIVEKQKKGGEAMKEIVSPVRRSSRIRSRSVATSP